MRKEVRWNPQRATGRAFTRREAHEIAYGVIMRMVARMELVEMRAQGGSEAERAAAKSERENSELALADLIGQVPAHPAIATPEGLAYIEMVKDDIAAIRKAQEAEQRRKIKASDPFAEAHAAQFGDLRGYAMVLMRQTQHQRAMRLPRRSS